MLGRQPAPSVSDLAQTSESDADAVDILRARVRPGLASPPDLPSLPPLRRAGRRGSRGQIEPRRPDSPGRDGVTTLHFRPDDLPQPARLHGLVTRCSWGESPWTAGRGLPVPVPQLRSGGATSPARSRRSALHGTGAGRAVSPRLRRLDGGTGSTRRPACLYRRQPACSSFQPVCAAVPLHSTGETKNHPRPLLGFVRSGFTGSSGGAVTPPPLLGFRRAALLRSGTESRWEPLRGRQNRGHPDISGFFAITADQLSRNSRPGGVPVRRLLGVMQERTDGYSYADTYRPN